ncbi:unnamed protein product [Oppiella nova]|uniref:Uncharacterized protein n=1 Tax=Oppiella nova TaxID=334625 RepID=A0A7R9MJE5_9ACAR|nr:unnamed protein product [Oppiella nova]CAG2178452.1 unnamed protein product [Oppiella nova]
MCAILFSTTTGPLWPGCDPQYEFTNNTYPGNSCLHCDKRFSYKTTLHSRILSCEPLSDPTLKGFRRERVSILRVRPGKGFPL